MYEALPDLTDLPGGPLGLGGGGLVAALVVLALLANQSKTPAERKQFNESIEKAVGGFFAAIGRYVSGRELVGEPRSEATWWKAGAPLPDDSRNETPLAQLGRASSSSAPVSLSKSTPSRARRVGRAVAAPFRLLGRSLAGLGRVLRMWHRWPRAARSAVRLAPLPAAWGFWRFPYETTVALIALAAAALVAALTSPAGLGWWRVPVKWTDRQIYGPGLWVAIRQILRVEETEARERWLIVPEDMNAPDARIVLRLPSKWMGGPEAIAAIERVIEERAPGEWVSRWERTTRENYAEWKPKPPKPAPVLPDYVPWKPTGDPFRVFLGQAIEGDSVVDAIVETKTATPHWGVAGDTGSGKSTVLYIPVVHGRQNGELIDILDTKRNSLQNAEGYSGVRIHKTVRECIAAFGEFLASMMAAEAVQEKGADPALRNQLVSRTLVVDELPTLIKLAYSWWRYGLKQKGTPPFLDWLGIILLQGRSSNHRVVVGTQQFANAFFGGTMERAQIGTRIAVGQQDRTSWGVAFGQSTPVLGFDARVKGRGAYSDKRKDPEADHLYVREIQPSYITPDVGQYLAQCPKAPAWFDAGEMAPWITEEILHEVNQTAATADFLPGGKHGPESLPAVAPSARRGIEGGLRRSQPTTGGDTTAGATAGATAAGAELASAPEEEVPDTYSLAQAYERGILPWKAATTRTYFKRGESRRIKAPEGVTDGQTSYYTEDELRAWLEKWKNWQEENKTAPKQRKEPQKAEEPRESAK